MATQQKIEDIMTRQVHTVSEQTSVREVARVMRDQQIGDVLVTDAAGKLCGIITDRDLVVRVIAEGKDPDVAEARDCCSEQLTTLQPDATVDDAVQMMRDRAIRRIPVVRGDVPVGIVSIGDLAQQRDPRSALADISAAAPNN